MRTRLTSRPSFLRHGIWLLCVASGLVLFFGCATHTTKVPSSTAPTVVASIEFMEGNLSGPVGKSQLGDWWTEKLKVGPNAEAYEFLSSTNGQNRINIETCQQYTNAIGQGAYAPTTADMVSELGFARAAAMLTFMEKAQPSRLPLPDDFLPRLPGSLIGWSGAEEEERISKDSHQGLTLLQYARLRKLTKWKQTSHVLTFQTEAKSFVVEEMARGDSDGNGTEDALISVTWRYKEGSGFGYELYVFTKHSIQPFKAKWLH